MAASKVPSSLMRWGRSVAASRIAAKRDAAPRGDSGGVPRAPVSIRDVAPRERGHFRARGGAAATAELHASEELRLVLREIAEAMSARAVILTMHPWDDRQPTVLLADDTAGFDQDAAEELLQGGHLSLDGGSRLAWSTWHGERGRHDVLMMPVAPVDGHSPLLISAIFDRLDADRRSFVEEVYLRRRPFAIGYFRLWQLERLRRHRITALQAAINLNEVGVMLLDRNGHIVFGNDAAVRLIDAGDGLARRASGLHATNLREDIRLQVALGHVIGTSQPGGEGESGGKRERRAPIMSISRGKGPPLILSVLPTGEPAEEPSDVAAILYVLDPVLDTNRYLEPLCKLFQLTPVETKLVCQLTGGATLAQAAETMHVKELTARSCLKQVFLKTGTNRQADLVRVMFSNLARTTRNIQSEVI